MHHRQKMHMEGRAARENKRESRTPVFCLKFLGRQTKSRATGGVERIFKHKSSHFHEKKYWSRHILDNLFLEVIKSYTQILKFFYYHLWPIAKFVSFLLWMMIATVICYITKLMEQSKEKGKGKKKKNITRKQTDEMNIHQKAPDFALYERKELTRAMCVYVCVCIYIPICLQVCVGGGGVWARDVLQ
jgi:hypothetical protein